MPRRAFFCAIALTVLTTSTAARAADQAGADALQADFHGFLADLQQVMPLRIEPAAPVRVTVKGDAYEVEIAPLVAVLDGPDGPVGELHLERTALRLLPDPDDPDATDFEVLALPAIEIRADGRPVVTISYGTAEVDGRWSDALDQAIAFRSRVTELSVDVDMLSFGMPIGVPTSLLTTVAAIESDAVMTPQPLERWALRSSMRLEDATTSWRPMMAGGEPQVIQHHDTLAIETSLTGVPAAAWRDYVVHWLPMLLTAEATGDALMRDSLISLATELPVPFDGLTMTSDATGIERQGMAIEREEQRLTIRDAALDVLELESHDSGSGISYRPTGGGDTEIDRLAAAMAPVSYSADVALHAVPIGHAWRELVDTIDVWIDEPEAGFDIFFRSFGSRARTLQSNGSLELNVTWPEARFDLSAALAASPDAALGVTGTFEGAFANMQSVGDALMAVDQVEPAAVWAMLQAFGQLEEKDGAAVTLYRLVIAPDGAVTFNGQDFGPIIHMVEGAFDAFSGEGFIPDQD